MNIKIEKKHFVNQLFESQEKQLEQIYQNPQIIITGENKIEDIITSKTNQFNFDCGSYLGTIPVKLNTKFCLYWYLNNTNTFEEFVSSIEKFLKNSENELTENDVKKLFSHYNKYIKLKIN